MPSQTGSIDLAAQVAANANAKDYTDSVEIGGRNLLRYTTKPSTTEWVGYGGNNTISRPGDEGLRITITGSGTHGIRVPLVADDCIADGEECMLSLDYRANVSSTGKIYLLCRTTPNVEHPAASITGDGEWHHLSMPISWSGMGDRVVFELLIGYISGTGNYFEVRDGTLKLEKGNKATDWSPAPEDASESIGAVQDDLDTTKSSVVWEGLCSSTTGTSAKVVECPGFTSSNLVEGARIRVRFKNDNTAEAISLNVNGTGAIGVYVGGADTSASNVLLIAAGADVDFTYTGTRWRIANQPGTYYATCAIAAATAAKTASYNGAVIYKGTTVNVLMTYENTSVSATFNFQGTGARAIYYGNTTTVPTAGNGYGWKAGETATLVFDGKFWRFATNTANAAKTATNYITDVSNDGIWITPEDAKPDETTHEATSTTSGWHISDAIELFRKGTSVIKAWAEDTVAKVRIGFEDADHLLLQNSGMSLMYNTDRLFEVSANGQRVNMYMGGSTRASSTRYSNAFVDELWSFLQSNGCYLLNGKVYTSTDTDTGLTTCDYQGNPVTEYDTSAGFHDYRICDSSYNDFDSGEYDGIYADFDTDNDRWLFYKSVRLYAMSEIPGAPTFMEFGGVSVDANSKKFSVRSESIQIDKDGTVWTAKDKTENMTLTQFAPYNKNNSNIPSCVRKGNLVMISGVVSPKTTVSNGDEREIGTIDVAFRPPREVFVLCPGGGSLHWLLRIKTNGSVTLSRYGNGSSYSNCAPYVSSDSVGSWCLLSATYLAN